jgi:hypothetical protein
MHFWRKRERERETDRERERDRQRQGETDRDRERQTERERQRETDRERQRETEREKERERERERERPGVQGEFQMQKGLRALSEKMSESFKNEMYQMPFKKYKWFFALSFLIDRKTRKEVII